MGNWRNRPPRRFFNRQRAPKSPPGYDKEPSSSGFCEDGIPLWEKKFCALIGSVPWQKVVHAKFVYSNNVLNWDDSAGKEAFQNAKKRFWAEINGFPCDISLPDPDIYIDEINWNPNIDPALIKDLESVHFAPDDGESDGKFGHKHKKLSRNLTAVASKACNETSEIIDGPWECNKCAKGSGTLKDKAQGWNHWGNNNNDSKNASKDDNPWERSFTQGDEVVKDKRQGWNDWENNNNDSKKLNCDNNPWEHRFNQGNEVLKSNVWGNCGNKLWGWDQGVNHVNQFGSLDNSGSSWERSYQGVYPVTGSKGWGDTGNNSWCWSQQKSWKLDNGDNPWEHRSFQNGGPLKDRGWRSCGGNAWGQKQWDNYSSERKHPELGRARGSWGAWNKVHRKREGSHLISYKSSGHHQDYKQTGHCWRSRGPNKRVQSCT